MWAVVLFTGNLKANDERIDCNMIPTIAKKGETAKCDSSAEKQ